MYLYGFPYLKHKRFTRPFSIDDFLLFIDFSDSMCKKQFHDLIGCQNFIRRIANSEINFLLRKGNFII